MPSSLPRTPSQIQRTLEATVAPRYEVLREIGRGGMAIVFQAVDRRDGRQVAIKVLHPQLTIVIGSARFQKEINILRKLQHPNILPVLESEGALGSGGQSAGSPLLYFIMPYSDGETLRACIDREGPLPLDRVLAITRDLASAIDYAHSQRVIHRDIKPDNVLLGKDRAIVTDFGVARAIIASGDDSFSSSGLVVGTPAYMSPEQAVGGAVDHRSDIYGLGCVVYEMLSGELPFSGATSQAIIARQVSERPRSLRLVRPEVPAAMEAAVMAALEKDPGKRPASGGELLSALGG